MSNAGGGSGGDGGAQQSCRQWQRLPKAMAMTMVVAAGHGAYLAENPTACSSSIIGFSPPPPPAAALSGASIESLVPYVYCTVQTSRGLPEGSPRRRRVRGSNHTVELLLPRACRVAAGCPRRSLPWRCPQLDSKRSSNERLDECPPGWSRKELKAISRGWSLTPHGYVRQKHCLPPGGSVVTGASGWACPLWSRIVVNSFWRNGDIDFEIVLL